MSDSIQHIVFIQIETLLFYYTLNFLQVHVFLRVFTFQCPLWQVQMEMSESCSTPTVHFTPEKKYCNHKCFLNYTVSKPEYALIFWGKGFPVVSSQQMFIAMTLWRIMIGLYYHSANSTWKISDAD